MSWLALEAKWGVKACIWPSPREGLWQLFGANKSNDASGKVIMRKVATAMVRYFQICSLTSIANYALG